MSTTMLFLPCMILLLTCWILELKSLLTDCALIDPPYAHQRSAPFPAALVELSEPGCRRSAGGQRVPDHPSAIGNPDQQRARLR